MADAISANLHLGWVAEALALGSIKPSSAKNEINESAPMWRERPLPPPATFIEPCLPRPAKQPPVGRGWIHEIKHDGFRIMVRRANGRVQPLNFSNRFPQIVAALMLSTGS